jgi:hypothetical protein
MMTYNIKLVSPAYSIILFILLFIVLSACVSLIIPIIVSQSFAIIFILVYITISYFLWQQLVTGRTEWAIDNDGFSLNWIKQFAFTKKPDISLKWNEIESISRSFDPNYYKLNIKLTSGQTIKFYHDSWARDDFKELIITLNETFSESKTTANKNIPNSGAEH